MRTFAELLREYTARTGVSDAELARAVGVQRQTVFRWKEGLVGRPRSAEDVLHLAAKLRLSASERDELLLAAGFPPVGAPSTPRRSAQDALGAPLSTADAPQADRPPSAYPLSSAAALPQPPSMARRYVLLAIVLLSIGAIAVAMVLIRQAGRYPQAAAGETLIVVAPFANYTGGAQGYNVAGRLVDALERETAAAGLADVRAAAWPDAVAGEGAADGVLERSGAGLLIWGEYDSGRVVTRFVPRNALGGQERTLLAATPADLPAVINSALPSDIRYVALASLARIYLDRGDAARALAALEQAGLSLPADPATQAGRHFLLGYAHQLAQPPDPDAAIAAYTNALALDGGLDAAYNNRAVAYLGRRGSGDLAAAVDDLTRYLAAHPDDSDAFNNRGSAYFSLGGEQNARRALADLDRAIALDGEHTAAHYNRGLAYVRLDETEKWRADFERVLDLESAHLGAVEGMCWGYALSEDPLEAIDWCGEAVEGRRVTAWENYAIACARSGDLEYARTILMEHRSEIVGTNDGASPLKSAQLDEWLAALGAGRDPFDEATIKQLREE